MRKSKQKCLPSCWEVTPPWLMSLCLKQSSPSPSPLHRDAPWRLSAHGPEMLSLLFYLLTRLLGHGVSQVTSPTTELCQSTFVAHSKYKQLSFPGIFFSFILFWRLFFFFLTLHKNHCRFSFTFTRSPGNYCHFPYILHIKKNEKVNRQRAAHSELPADTEASVSEREASFHRQRLARGDHTC